MTPEEAREMYRLLYQVAILGRGYIFFMGK